MAMRKPTVTKRRQVTLPRALLEAAGLREGAALDVRLTDEGILIERAPEHDPDQAWFWTPEWQAKEREADEDYAAGRFTIHYSDEEFDAALRARMKPL